MWVEVRAKERPAPPKEPVHDVWSGSGIEVDARTDIAPPPPADVPAAPAAPVEPSRAEPWQSEAKRADAPQREGAPQRAIRPRTAATLRAKPASAASTEARASSDAASPGATPSGSTTEAPAFGAAGLPPGVRHLPRAFARAVALANRADAAWRTLPAGVVGEASVALPVEENGTLGSLTFDDDRERERLLPAVRRLLDNTVLLLSSGRFSLKARELSGGVMRVRVRVEILEQTAKADPDVDPNELNAIDYEAPQPGKPGHGAFLLNSGRRVVCWVMPLG